MNVVINSQTLATELRLLNRVVPSKPAIQILSHALLTADDQLRLYATDLEVGLSSSCPAQINMPGSVAVPVAKLLALVEQFPDADVTIALDKKQVAVSCGAFNSRLQALPADDFPQPPDVEGASCRLDGAALRQLIARTRYAINATATKFVMQGALLTLQGAVAAMVATDGKRLSLATASRSGPDMRVIIPIKTLGMIDGDEIEMTVGGRHLFFASGGRLLTSRMLDGNFPAYERIIPRDNTSVVTVDRGALTAALRRICVVSEGDKVYIEIEPGRMLLTTSSAEVGSADEEVPSQYGGAALKVCINGGYVLDFLDASSAETITLAFKDANSAVLLTDGEAHVGVVMLIRG